MEMELAGFWVAVAVALASLFWWWNDYWYALPFRLHRGGVKLPPGYMGIPFIGEMPAFLWYFKVLCRPDDFINAKRRKYGDGIGLYRTYLFGSPTIITCTPSATKMVLQDESSFSVSWNNVELVGATSLVAVEGPAHSRVRALVVRAVNQPDALQAKKVTLASIGMYFASIELEDVLETIDDLVKGIINGLRAYPINFPGTALHYALQCRRRAKAIFRKELEKRNKFEASVLKNDLMEALMQMKDEEGNRLSEDEVLDNIVTLIIAGYTSTSVAIMWAVYYLAKYPEILLRLREEHMLICKKLGDLVTYEEIASCKYTAKVVEEIIRMANISSFVVRTAKKDVDYKGYRIPKGWKVACWLRYFQTNPEHFEDPMCFNPDRWNEAPKAGSYLVFGGGPRMCAGNMFARLQVAVLLHHLVLGYRWKLVNPNAGMTYLPHPNPADDVEIDITQI
ncbi:ent-kaurenoic acid monooxygenase [Salvia divinorum]|uniref:Ent-kaurenoic acid monooxygenase n=1 Tax=Salvia divinorum TaxID=28513 RepID=A0ABD1GCY3_SALDI